MKTNCCMSQGLRQYGTQGDRQSVSCTYIGKKWGGIYFETGVGETYRPVLVLGEAQWIILCQRGYRPSV
jgi:hypothetical protein